jgi:AcrR family transcriptional regulator
MAHQKKQRKRPVSASIANAMVAGVGTGELARELGVDRTTVWRRLQNPEVKAAIESMRATLAAGLIEKVEEALLANLENIIQGLKTATGAEAGQLQDRLFEVIEKLQPAPPAIAAPGIIETTAARAGTMTLRETLMTLSREKEGPTQ